MASINPGKDNLISWWAFDESSGNAADSHGSKTLTNYGTTGFATGIIGNCADLGTANSTKYFNRTDQLGLTVNAARSFGCTFKIRTEPGSGVSFDIMKIAYPTEKVAYYLSYRNPSGTKMVRVSRIRTAVTEEVVDYNVTLGTSDWHQLIAVLSGTDLRIYLDGTDRGNTTVNTGNGSGGTPDGTFLGGTTTNAYIDESFAFNDALSADEVTWLYNGGSFRYYGQLSSIPQVICF